MSLEDIIYYMYYKLKPRKSQTKKFLWTRGGIVQFCFLRRKNMNMNMDMEKLSPTEMTRRIYEIIE